MRILRATVDIYCFTQLVLHFIGMIYCFKPTGNKGKVQREEKGLVNSGSCNTLLSLGTSITFARRKTMMKMLSHSRLKQIYAHAAVVFSCYTFLPPVPHAFLFHAFPMPHVSRASCSMLSHAVPHAFPTLSTSHSLRYSRRIRAISSSHPCQ